MHDDYEDDFDDFEDVKPRGAQKKVSPPKPSNDYNFGSSNNSSSRVRPTAFNSNTNKKEEDNDDYDDDFEDAGNKNKPTYNVTSNTKPLGLSNKPDWLKSDPTSNKPDWLKKNDENKSSGVTASKPAPQANNSTNAYSAPKQFANAGANRKAEAISENRGINSKFTLNNNKKGTTSEINIANVNNPGAQKKQGEGKKASRKSKREFSLEPPPKPKKIQLPKDYLDKYTKNNPVRDLEKSLASIKDNIKKLQKELAESKSIPNEYKRQKVLQRINKELRTELKRLSESSTIL